MCRMLGMSGNLESCKDEVLGEFRKLSVCGKVPISISPDHPIPAGHKDGWGLIAYGQNKAEIVFSAKNPVSADDHLGFSWSIKIMRSLNPLIIIGHLRKASVGDKSLVNTHPFVFENFSFCHNGSVSFTSDDFLEPDYKKLVNGQTDSEKLFFLLMQLVFKNNGSVPLAITELLRFIRGRYDYTALNFLLADGQTIWALREINESNEWVKKLNLLDYYTLYCGYDSKEKAKLICSEPLPMSGWEWDLVPNHALAIIKTNVLAGLIVT